MSNPDDAATQNEGTIDFETEVNALVDNLSNPDWQPGEDVNPAFLYAAKAEKRRRDTQSEFTKNQQKLKATELRASKLEEKLSAAIMESLPLKQQTELEELKNTDPDAWRAKLAKLEDSAKGELAKELQTINDESNQLSEKERREQVFEQFQKDYPTLTGDMIENDVPPRVKKKLEKGEITFEQFLEESAKFLTATKVIEPGETAPEFANLSKLPGGSKPGEDDTNKAANAGYDKEVY